MKVTIDLGDTKNECFVLMPFSTKFDLIYAEVLRPAIEDIGLVPARADQIYGSRRIMGDVWNGISTARIIIAELTGRNANVLYELGLAHALGKPFVIITNSMDDVPFDLKDLRCIVYDKDHPKWGDSLARNVSRTMRSVLQEVDKHGPLFPEIETDTDYREIDAQFKEATDRTEVQPETSLDITGTWSLNHSWSDAVDSYTTLSIQQNNGSITGYCISSPREENEKNKWSVSQQVSGFIRGNEFELAATSYQILESDGELDDWVLDNWKGTVENEDFIHGELSDEADHTGIFWGERTGKNPVA